ncbi:MAG: thiamine ABC transporter substrate binding subunit [Devosia sp.]|uniref:thiamine ABC transporter substrate binding subunit n=1 Tax=Devosia sp. TaxID=1871048 RepID=UPI001A5F84F7|nr:thiamine ABC transporter substrate binding subunit [Devosia sp.]MBL8597256.1 thiamine ABC transporter substrate binding subunit [Devosia sp.]
MLRPVILAFAAFLALGHPAAAQDKPNLTVYTYDSFTAEWGPGPALKAGFEASCACTLTYVAAEDGISAFRRVQLEGPTTKADLVVGLDNFIAGDARASGLFAPHGLDLSGLNLPQPWTEADFVPFDYGYFAFVYNKETVPTPPTSFEELMALPESFKIVVMDPRSSTPGLGLVVWIRQAYGDRAPEIWAGLKPHILTMSRGWSEGYGLFLKGEADMVVSYTTSPAFHALTENDTRYAAATFSEGHIAQIEVSGILRSSPNQDLARQFLTYMISAEGQKAIPQTNWMFPVIDLGADLPEAFGAPPAKTLPVDEAAVTANRNAWIEEALAAIR